MTKDPFLVFMEKVTKVEKELERRRADYDMLEVVKKQEQTSTNEMSLEARDYYACHMDWVELIFTRGKHDFERLFFQLIEMWSRDLTSLVSEEGQPPLIGGRKLADAIVVSAVVLLSFVYLYLVGYIDRGGSEAGSSGSLDFRDIYISTLLFQAAYVWIKFRDVIPSIPRGAVYRRPGSNKWEPRIKFPVTRGSGVRSKRIPLGLYDTRAEAEVAYQIAAFYCNKRKHTGRLDLGGGAYFSIAALSMDSSLPYEKQVNQVGVQVLRIYAEFEERRKASRNSLPSVPRQALEMATGEGQISATSPIQQLPHALNSGIMDSAIQGQGSQPAPDIHNGVDFIHPGSILPVFTKTQQELHEAFECLKSQASQLEIEKNDLKQRNLELERRNSQLKQRNSELEHDKGLWEHQKLQLQSQLQHSQLQPLFSDLDFGCDVFTGLQQSQLQPLSSDPDFGTDMFLGNEELSAR